MQAIESRRNDLAGEAMMAIVNRVAASPTIQSSLWDAGMPIFPAEILENNDVGEPARRCWMVFWRWAGCKPGHVKCDAGNVMAALHAADKRTVRGYRNELAKIGALAIIDDGRQWVLYVNDPREVTADRPKVTGLGHYRYFAFMQYQADEAEPCADQSGSFCAKTPAISPAGSFCAKTPDPELIDFSENLRRRQSQEQERVARQAPPPAGDSILQVARRMQERSNVLETYSTGKPQDVLKNVLENDGKNAKGENVEAVVASSITTGERWHRDRDLLIRQLGPNAAYPWQPWAIVLIRHVGLIGEGELAKILATAAAPSTDDRWAYAWGSVKKQLGDRGAEACLATGLFCAADATMPFFIAIRRRLKAAGLRLDKTWELYKPRKSR